MRPSRTRSIGMDVHNDSMAVAAVAQEQDAEVVDLGPIGTRPCDSKTLLRTRHAQGHDLVLVDAAGPCGSWLDRSLTQPGDVCRIIAPALIPTKAGDRVKTDRRNAVPLARLLRSGDLTPVSVPTVADEAIHDLRRAREEALRDLQAAPWRLNASLLRHDIRDTGRASWGPAHRRWLRAIVLSHTGPAHRLPGVRAGCQ